MYKFLSGPFSSLVIRVFCIVEVLCEISHKNIHFKTVIRIKMGCAESPSVEWLSVLPFQDLLLSITLQTWRALSQETTRASIKSPHSVTRGPCHLKTSPKNNYQLEELCFQEDLKNEDTVSSPVSLMNDHFRTLFQVWLYQCEELCPRRPQQHPLSLPTVSPGDSGI